MRGSKERRRSISGLTLIESDECAAESSTGNSLRPYSSPIISEVKRWYSSWFAVKKNRLFTSRCSYASLVLSQVGKVQVVVTSRVFMLYDIPSVS